jgi:hypothetical protein
MYVGIRAELSDGFPVDSWSASWVFGSIALCATVLLGGRVLWSWFKGNRVPRRKRRCPSCGELCPKQARVCSHCNEWFPAWKLLSPPSPQGSEPPTPEGRRYR